MKQKNTDQAARRRQAWQSAVLFTVCQLVSGGVLLILRGRCVPEGFWAAVLLIFGLLDLGMIIPVWILLKKRLKEIEGGEEDAASQY